MSNSWKQSSFPVIPVACTAGMLAMTALPRVSSNARLAWSVAGAAFVLLAWELLLWARRRAHARDFPVEFVAVKSHWVQAAVQFSIMLYWGWFWRDVYAELPLVAVQILFLYSLEALISWSRGRTWKLGYGPLPIILSTNLLLWFKDDWYAFQFVMIALGVMGKQFMTWKLPDRQGHIFNPSAFGQSLVALVLIATVMTKEMTWGPQIAATFEAPDMLIVIFVGGLVVQYLFGVTLMTLAAAATLALVNLVYTQVTGVYFFIDLSIAAPIFLGIHLLVTDPSTSPRSNLGRVVFGAAYALAYCVLFRALDIAGIPTFWDKLLPVPILNLCVPLIDRVCRHGLLGQLNAAWEGAFSARKLNLVHMGCWVVLFGAMITTGFAYGTHPGNSLAFWQQAVKDGKPFAERSLVLEAASQALSTQNGEAFNVLGLASLGGKGGLPQNRQAAAQSFSQACDAGDISGCENVVMQFLFLREMHSEDGVRRAFQSLEASCAAGGNSKACYLLGTAFELGRGPQRDLARAAHYFQQCGTQDLFACKALARLALGPQPPVLETSVMQATAATLVAASEGGDAEASWYVAYLCAQGIGLPPDPQRAAAALKRACDQGSSQACEALKLPGVPPFRAPVASTPAWSGGS
jgi:TPR repeat protein